MKDCFFLEHDVVLCSIFGRGLELSSLESYASRGVVGLVFLSCSVQKGLFGPFL